MPYLNNPRTGKAESFAYPSSGFKEASKKEEAMSQGSSAVTAKEPNDVPSLSKKGSLHSRSTSYTKDVALPK